MERTDVAEALVIPETKMIQQSQSGKKTRKQTRFSIASSSTSPGPLGTITNLVLPGVESPAKNEQTYMYTTTLPAESLLMSPQQFQDFKMEGDATGYQQEYDSDENEVFFGPINDYEQRKANKLRRRTVAFKSNFREYLLKTPSKGSSSRIMNESNSADEKENSTAAEDNSMDVTVDSVFSNSLVQKTDCDLKIERGQSTFYSTYEFVIVDSLGRQSEIDCNKNETIYHQALTENDIATAINTNSKIQVKHDLTEGLVEDFVSLENNEARPVNIENQSCNGKTESISDAHIDSPAKQRLAANKIQGWFRMNRQKRSYNRAFKDMTSLKDKTVKFLQELKIEQESRNSTPTNSPVPVRIFKIKDTSENEMTEVDGRLTHNSIYHPKHNQSFVTDTILKTASQLQSIAGIFTPTRGTSTSYVGSPQAVRKMNLGNNSPLFFSSPKAFPVTVQAQQSRNPMCTIPYSPRTPIIQTMTTTSWCKPISSNTYSPKMSLCESTNASSSFPYKSSPLVKPVPIRPNSNSIVTSGSASGPVPSAFISDEATLANPFGLNPIAHLVFQSPGPTDSQMMPNQGDTVDDTSNKNSRDSPNVTRRARKNKAVKPAAVLAAVHNKHTTVTSTPSAFQTTSNYATSPGESLLRGTVSGEIAFKHAQDVMSPGSVTISGQEAVMSLPQPLQQINQLSLLQQKQIELARIRAEKQILQQQINEDNAKEEVTSSPLQKQEITPGSVMISGQEAAMSLPQPLQQINQLSLLQQKQMELAQVCAEKQMVQQQIKEDNAKCFQMRNGIIAALKSNMSPEGLPPVDSHVVIHTAEGTSTLTLNGQELDLVTRLHTIRNGRATVREQTYNSPVTHHRHQTGRVRLQWHQDLVTSVSELSSPHLDRLSGSVSALSILTHKTASDTCSFSS